MESLKKKFSNFFKDYDPSNKYIKKPIKPLHKIFENINNKKSWDLKEAKQTVDYLYYYQIKHYNNNSKEDKDKSKKIEFYINYLNYQINVLNDFQNHLLTLIATIFLPLTFITGFLEWILNLWVFLL